ncbi:MAG: tRNA (guanosine(46)-N7)-methyltransferase TrmB [Erysipelotrichaceae bacterium]|nr:tRNA (guanosine(46)-N7)-methyltransferase TrmB [Erysipelotrichaceae bacterium]
MRMRNKPWALAYLSERPDCIRDPQNYKGKWKELLGSSVLHIEIGSGKGDWWLKMSEMVPDEGWLAIEKDKNVSATALKKDLQLQANRRWILGDAAELEEWFAKGEVDVIHLNFTDPWPKKHHAKRRLAHFRFLQRYDKILGEDGTLILKTDNQAYFEFSLCELSQAGWRFCEVDLDYRQEPHQEEAISEYEAKFVSLGKPIYRVKCHRSGGLHEAHD